MSHRFLYHAHVSTASRAKGHSVAAGIAYIGGLNFYDYRFTRNQYYRKRRGVLRYEIFNYPHGVQDMAFAIELAERRKNATIARHVNFALPSELSEDDRWKVTRRVAEGIFNQWGLVSIAALHAPSLAGDRRNDHAHIIFSTRRYENGCFGSKAREFDGVLGYREIIQLRQLISESITLKLRDVGREEETPLWGHRSYHADRLAFTPGFHRGKKGRIPERPPQIEEPSESAEEGGPTEYNPFASIATEIANMEATLARRKEEQQRSEKTSPTPTAAPAAPSADALFARIVEKMKARDRAGKAPDFS